MKKYIISQGKDLTKKSNFKEIEGHIINNAFAAHKEDLYWVLDDLRSGCKIADGLPSFSACKSWIKEKRNLIKYNDAINKTSYKNFKKGFLEKFPQNNL